MPWVNGVWYPEDPNQQVPPPPQTPGIPPAPPNPTGAGQTLPSPTLTTPAPAPAVPAPPATPAVPAPPEPQAGGFTGPGGGGPDMKTCPGGQTIPVNVPCPPTAPEPTPEPEPGETPPPTGQWIDQGKPPGPPAAGGGYGGGPGIPSFDFGPGYEHESDIWQFIEDMMNGNMSAYSPAALERMYGKLLQTSQGRARAAREEIRSDAVSRGMFRSGMVSDAMAGVQRGVSADVTKGMRSIMMRKAEADVKLKLQGLQQAQVWLQQRRNYVLAQAQDSLAREMGMAQIELGYAQINSQIQMLQMQLAGMGGGDDNDIDADLLGQLLDF